MNEMVAGLLADCLTVKGVEAAGTIAGAATIAINRVITKRHKILQEVILSEIRQGVFDHVDEDELISIFIRISRDAEEGVAKRNLRLMMSVINGMAEKNELKAPSFLKYANILASLSEDEISVLGIMMKDATRSINTLDRSKKGDLLLSTDPGKSQLEKEVPNYRSIQQALLRTGLIIMELDATTEQVKKRPDPMDRYRTKPAQSSIAFQYPVNSALAAVRAEEEKRKAEEAKEPEFDIKTKPYYTFKFTPLMVDLSQYLQI